MRWNLLVAFLTISGLVTVGLHLFTGRHVAGASAPLGCYVIDVSCGSGTILLGVYSGAVAEAEGYGFYSYDLGPVREAFSTLTEAGVECDPYARGFSCTRGASVLPDGSSFSSFSLSAPFWVAEVALLTAVVPVCWLRFIRPRLRVRSGHCRACAYDLRGLSEQRCPECNTPFELQEGPGGTYMK